MSHLQLTPEGHPLEDAHLIPIDDPDEPMTEAVLRELELDRAADEGMIEPPGPEMDVQSARPPDPGRASSRPGRKTNPAGLGSRCLGRRCQVPSSEPADPPVEAPGRDDRPPIVSAVSPAAGLSQTAWRAA